MKNVGTSLVAAALVLVIAASTYAFPPFKTAFEEKYVKGGLPALQAAYKDLGCNVCHVKGAESKKERNPYGAELDKLLTGDIKERLKTEKEKVLKELDEAFTKSESLKAPSGKTWGEAVKAGEFK